MNRKRMSAAVLTGLLCTVSLSMRAETPEIRGAVLSPEQSVEASNKNGKIKISYVSPIKRKYEWDRVSKVIKMIPREEPFERKLGLYDPADSWGLNPFEVRLVVEESVINFENEVQVYSFLRQSSNFMEWVYTSDGLVVGFSKTPARKQINIDLWQIWIHGEKPSALKGAKDNDIRLTSGKRV